MIAALRAGELNGFVVQNPLKIGYLGVTTIVRHIRGEQVPGRIDTGSTLVTRENLDQPEIRELLSPDIKSGPRVTNKVPTNYLVYFY
jgi:ribose transport system substrate-binding protein